MRNQGAQDQATLENQHGECCSGRDCNARCRPVTWAPCPEEADARPSPRGSAVDRVCSTCAAHASMLSSKSSSSKAPMTPVCYANLANTGGIAACASLGIDSSKTTRIKWSVMQCLKGRMGRHQWLIPRSAYRD